MLATTTLLISMQTSVSVCLCMRFTYIRDMHDYYCLRAAKIEIYNIFKKKFGYPLS